MNGQQLTQDIIHLPLFVIFKLTKGKRLISKRVCLELSLSCKSEDAVQKMEDFSEVIQSCGGRAN